MTDSPSHSGKRFGAFRTVRQLGAGTQGMVFQAVAEGHASLADGTEVALKVISLHGFSGRPDAVLAAYRPLVGQTLHPALVRYLDAFLDQAEGKTWLCAAMEFVEGRSLADRVHEKPGGMVWAQAWPLLSQMLDGFCALSAAGLVHRDIKPGNVILSGGDRVKIIDLDLSPKAGVDADATVAWQGSLEYMAPDFVQIKGFSGDERSDVFSFAVMAFELLTGERPFGDLGERPDLAFVQRWRKGNDTMPDFRHSCFRIHEALQAAFHEALEQDPERRIPTFAALKERLSAVRSRVLEFQGGESFELLDLLGRGGFGEVYKARRKSDGQVFAVKHLHSQEYSKRFLKEANILKNYAHPSIVGYGGLHSRAGKTGELEYFLVMEFLAGETLSQRIKNAPEGLPAREVMEMFGGYCRALHHLHASEHQIIHRDLKPGNLYAPAGKPGEAKLFDMGIARDVSGTQTFGHIPGTLNYMAPEFAKPEGGRGTPQSDIYALGFCLYEALVGDSVVAKLPKDLDQAYIAFFKRSQRPLVIDFDKPAFREFPGLMRVVAKALAYEPASRYASAEAMGADLAAVLRPPTRGEEQDFEVTLSQVVSPKLVITQQWADENMRDWDDSKFVPDKLPSEVGHEASPAGRRLVIGLVAALLLAIGAVVYLKFFKPPEIEGVNEQWMAQLQAALADAKDAASPDALTKSLEGLQSLRGQPDAEKTGQALEEIEQALRRRALVLASNAYAEATGLVSRVDLAAADEKAALLGQFATFVQTHWQDAGATQLVTELQERISSTRALTEKMAADRQAMAGRLIALTATVKDAASARQAAEAVTKISTNDWAPVAGTPEVLPHLEKLREAVNPALLAEVARVDDPAGRLVRLEALEAWLRSANPGRVVDLTGLAQAVAGARKKFIWQVANPTELPLALASPLLPAGTQLAPGAQTNLVLAAEQPAEIEVMAAAGPAYEPVPIRLAVQGGAGAVGSLPKPGLRAVALVLNKADFAAGTPRPRLQIKGGVLADWSAPPAKLAPGAYAARFTREDYAPQEIAFEAKPGAERVTVNEPAENAWIPSPPLAALEALEALAAADHPSLPEKSANPLLDQLVWTAHRERAAALRAKAKDMIMAGVPALVDAAWLRVDDFLGWLVQLRDPMSASRARFRSAEPYAGAAPALPLPGGWESAGLPPATLERIRFVQPFVAHWGAVAAGDRTGLAAALKALGTPLAQDAAAALIAPSPQALPVSGAGSSLLPRWQAHAGFDRDFSTSTRILARLEESAKLGGRMDRHDLALALWCCHLIWDNAVASVKDDTRLGGKRHSAESEQAGAALRHLSAIAEKTSAAEIIAAAKAMEAKAASTADLRQAPVMALAGLGRARGGEDWKVAAQAELDRQRAAFEAKASPAELADLKRRLANLNYLLLE